jgi:hypothetical protein
MTEQNRTTLPDGDVSKTLLPLLARRGLVTIWAERVDPIAELHAECRVLVSDEERRGRIVEFLTSNPIISEALSTLLAQLAMATSVRWQDTSVKVQPLSWRGWHLGRWIPTFLLVDGPLGRLLRAQQSPLNELLRRNHMSFPLLAEARDTFNHELFRIVRNGFAHWSFTWRGTSPGASHIAIIDWKTGEQQAELSLLEAEALHFITARVIMAIDQEILAVACPEMRGG